VKCTQIKAGGERCKSDAIQGTAYCYMHDPAHAEERKRHAAKGGRRAKRATADLKRLQSRLEELAQQVLDGEVDRADASVAGQLLGAARACIRDSLAAKEQEELIERLEALEAAEGERGTQWGA
jgi:sirohydrochlorin ferrochelatase